MKKRFKLTAILGTSLLVLNTFNVTTFAERHPENSFLQDTANEDSSYQDKIDEIRDIIIQATKLNSLSDLNSAKQLVNEINEPEKTSLIKLINSIESSIKSKLNYPIILYNATNAVSKAERTKNQTDVNSAMEQVLILEEIDQVDLIERLKEVQKIIDLSYRQTYENALNQVIIAEITKQEKDIQIAKEQTLNLNENDQKMLQKRLDMLYLTIQNQDIYKENLQQASDALQKAQRSLKQSDLDIGKVLIKNLNTKDQDRLNKVAQIIQENIVDEQYKTIQLNNYNEQLKNIEEKVLNAEHFKEENDFFIARNAIDNMKQYDQPYDSFIEVKANFTKRLNIAEESTQIPIVIEAIMKAETSKERKDYEYAKFLVDCLKYDSRISDFKVRLDNLYTTIINGANTSNQLSSAKSSLEKIEKNPNTPLYDYYFSKINSLHSSLTKDLYLSRFFAVGNTLIADSNNAVIKAEKSQSQSDILFAKELVNNLEDSEAKALLNKRLDSIYPIDEHFLESLNSLLIAEKSMYEPDINKAKSIIYNMSDEKTKILLLNRINAIVPTKIKSGNNSQTDVSRANILIQNAEKHFYEVDSSDYFLVKNQIESLLGSVEKDFLITRLIALHDEQIKDALNAVKKAEETLNQSDIESAHTLVKEISNDICSRSLNAHLRDIEQKSLKQKIDVATEVVKTAIKSGYKPEIEYAKSIIPSVKDEKIKNDLLIGVELIVENDSIYGRNTLHDIEFVEEMLYFGETYNQSEAATNLVNNLLGSPIKDYFIARLKGQQGDEVIQNTVNLIKKSEKSRNQRNVNKAREEAKKITDEVSKRGVMWKLDTINESIVSNATILVEKAELSGEKNDIEMAMETVNDTISELSLKNNLINRCEVVFTETENFIIKKGVTPENEKAIKEWNSIQTKIRTEDYYSPKESCDNSDYNSYYECWTEERLNSVDRRGYIQGMIASIVYPDAGNMLLHYLNSSGKKHHINFYRMLYDNEDAMNAMVEDLEKARIESEQLLENRNNHSIKIKTKEEFGHDIGGKHYILENIPHLSYEHMNWFASIHGYRTWIDAEVKREDEHYTMYLNYHLRDIYDFTKKYFNEENLVWDTRSIGLLQNYEMAFLFDYNRAKPFKVEGKVTLKIEWDKGEELTKDYLSLLIYEYVLNQPDLLL